MKECEKLWLLPSRFVLLVDSVSTTLCDISAVGFNTINGQESVLTVRIVLFMALPISFDECSKQPQPDHRLLTS